MDDVMEILQDDMNEPELGSKEDHSPKIQVKSPKACEIVKQDIVEEEVQLEHIEDAVSEDSDDLDMPL